ncbi:MAG: hypothetical protein ABIL70_09410, partial [candidate division WOR-3 bacterium]
MIRKKSKKFELLKKRCFSLFFRFLILIFVFVLVFSTAKEILILQRPKKVQALAPGRYNAGPIKTLPSGANGVSVTPATSWGAGTWTPITASIPHDIVLEGVVVGGGPANEFEIDIGKGASGSEVVVGKLAGDTESAASSPRRLYFPIPIDNISAGSRIVARARVSGTTATAFFLKLIYYEKPLSGNIATTQNSSLLVPSQAAGVSVTLSSTAWANSSWYQVIASTSDAIVVGAVTLNPAVACEFELDIGKGASGSETVVTTIRGRSTTAGGPQTITLNPLVDNIGSSTRVAVRIRANTTTTTAWTVKLTYYNKTNLGVGSEILTTKPLKWAPSATNGASVTPSATAWANSSWVQLIASTSTSISLAAVELQPASAVDFEIEFGIGASGSEVPIGLVRGRNLSTTLGNIYTMNIAPLIKSVPSGSRLAVRIRTSGTTTTAWRVAVGYYEDTDTTNAIDAPHSSLPYSANSVTLSIPATAWSNSNYGQLTSGLLDDIYITRIIAHPGASVQFEVDIAIGASGKEQVLITVAGQATSGTGNSVIDLSAPLKIPAGNRIAMRMRGNGTTASTGYVSLEYVTEEREIMQSGYRFFNNTNSTDVGSPLAPQDTMATFNTSGMAFRLRMLLHIGGRQLSTSGQAFKLQFASKGAGTCSSPGGTWTDVTTSTTIAFYDNSSPTDGSALTANSNDPIHLAHASVNQTYEEANNFTNSQGAILAGQDGKWDFSLRDNGMTTDAVYCLRVVKSDGTALNSYSVYPEITRKSAPNVQQEHYRWKNDASYVPSSFSFTHESSPQIVGHTEPDVIKVGDTYYLYYRANSHIEVATSSDGVNWSGSTSIITPSSPTGPNILPNSNVETGSSSPTGWNSSGGSATWSTTYSRSPTHSLRLNVSNASADWRANGFTNVAAGNYYQIGGYVRGTATSGEFFLTIRWFSDSSCSTFISESNAAISTGTYGSWTLVKGGGKAPNNTQCADFLFRAINATGDLYADDFYVKEAPWDNVETIAPSIYYNTEDGLYYLFYEGNNGSFSEIGYAVSKSPTGPFEKSPYNPVLSPTGSGWESITVGTPVITRDNNKWYLYYHGYNGTNDQTGLAWSTNLKNWTRHPSNPIVPIGSSGQWDDYKTAPSSVFIMDNMHYLFYEGEPDNNDWKIGVAYVSSANIETSAMTKFSSNPIFSETPGSWDDDYVQLPSVIRVGDQLWMYYSGHNAAGNSFSLGRAVDSTGSIFHWKAAEDTAITNQVKNQNIRLRFSLKNAGGIAENYNYRLQVAQLTAANCNSQSTGWSDVPTTTGGCGTSVACMTTSSYFTKNDKTTNLLSSPGSNYLFQRGEMIEDDINQTGNITLYNIFFTEAEYNFQFTNYASDGATYCFRVTNAGTALNSYNSVATVTLASAGISLSGNAYENETSTVLSVCDGSTNVISLRVGNTTYGPVPCSASDGSFTITGITQPSAGDPMILWIDNQTPKATTITKYSGSGNVTGVEVRKDRLVIMSDYGNVTNSDLDTWDSGNDSDIIYSVSSNNLTLGDGYKLIVNTGDTYQPGGTITTSPSSNSSTTDGDILIKTSATLNMESYDLSIGGDFTNQGTLTLSSNQTTTFTATSTGHTIAQGSSEFENVVFNGTGGGWQFNSSTTINKDLTMTAGTLSGTQDITVKGGDTTGNGTINLTGGTFLLDGTGNFGGNTDWTFYNLTFGDGTGSETTTAQGTGQITSNTLTISQNQTLNASSKTFNLAGSGTPFTVSGTFTPSTSTINYNGTSATTITNTSYYNLGVGRNPDSSAVTYSLSADLTIPGRLTVGHTNSTATDTLSASSYNITFSGGGIPFMLATGTGDFSCGTSTVKFTSASTTNIQHTTYYNLYLQPSSSGNPTYTLGLSQEQTITVQNDLIFGDGTNAVTVTPSNNTIIQISRNLTLNASSTFTKSDNSSFVFYGTQTSSITDNNSTKQDLGNLFIGDGTNTKTVNVSSSLALTDMNIRQNATLYIANSSYTLTVNGHWKNQGTFTSQNNSVNFAGVGFARAAGIGIQEGENQIRSAVIDTQNGYAYFGTETSPGKVVKVNLSTLDRVGAITLNSGENNLYSAVIDTQNGYAYFGTDTSPGRVVKIDLSTFQRVGAITLNSGENNLYSAVIDTQNGYAYFGTWTSPGIVVKINLSTFQRVGAITLNSGENDLYSAVIDTQNGYAYFGTYTTPGIVVKINLSTFSRVGAITLNSGENYLTSAVIDTQNGYAYFGTWTSPGRVVKIDLSTFSRVGAITLNSGENYLTSAVIDTQNGYAYFGTNTTPGIIVKINLSTFSRVGAITLNSGEDYLLSAVIDTQNGYAYFGIAYNSSLSFPKVVKINLSNFQRVEAITLVPIEEDCGEGSYVQSAIIDVQNGYVYFGTEADSARLAKVRIFSSIFTNSSSFYNVGFNNTSGDWHFQDATDIDNNLTITNGKLTAYSGNTYIGGNFSNSGTFNHNSGTVIFDDNTKTTTISGSTTFYNLTSTTPSKNIVFTAGTTQTIASGGTLTFNGQACDTMINLSSSSSPNQWNINVQSGATTSINYVDVSDSNATGQAITANNSFQTNDNNTNWTINAGVCGGISLSGNAYENETSTVLSVCDGSTNVISLRVGNTTYGPVPCSASDGSFTIT